MATDELWCQSDPRSDRYLRVHFLPGQVKRAGSFTGIRRGKLLAVVSGGARGKAVFLLILRL